MEMFSDVYKLRCLGEKVWQPNQEDVWMLEEGGGGLEKFAKKDSSQRSHHNLFFCLPKKTSESDPKKYVYIYIYTTGAK